MTVITGHCHRCDASSLLYPVKSLKENAIVHVCFRCREFVKALRRREFINKVNEGNQ